MEIFKIVSVGLIGLFIFLIFKDRRDIIAVLVGMVTGILIFLFIIDKLSAILHFMQEIALKANIDTVYLNMVFKIVAIAFLASFGSELCRDAEAKAIANTIELSGKILILVLALPILMSLLESILKIM
ncbi:stage III sporulation protein AD [Clostridium polynesiense]|uniref:stage III sporulation protein AD n=1 Tax=Clostridium polynesiense TaxID=1325933 RepID=UPI00058FD1F2|nr:stage III sporulation protein AD [Clostridium polynesiense]